MVADASTFLCKYGSIVVLDRMKLEVLLPLMMLRQNIYTDPQKPIQVDPKVYPIGETGKDSPVLVTTNFSLTYFLVSGEIENSGIPANLLVVDTEGMSVLTGWAAGKFSGEKVANAVKASGLAGRWKTSHHHSRLRLADQRRDRGRPARAGKCWSVPANPRIWAPS